MTMSGGSSRHTAVLVSPGKTTPNSRQPTPGKIAVLPDADPFFVRAVEASGGVVEPVSDETRGIVWLSYSRASELPEILHENPQIEWVQLPWAGVDAFSKTISQSDSEQSLLWTSAKGAYAQPVAEHALALILSLLRRIPERVRAKSWGAKFGTSLYGLSVVIVGAGGIAVELMRLLRPFGVNITIVRRTDLALPGADQTVTTERLVEVLPGADVVVIAAALTDETTKLFGSEQLGAMKPSAILVNVARGGLIDTAALVEALDADQIAGVGLDVTDPEPLPSSHELWNFDKVLITPHSADTPEMTSPLLAERIRVNVRAFLNQSEFEGIVDPEVGY